MRLSEVIPDFLMAKEVEEGCRPTTINAYHYDLEILCKELGNIEIEQIRVFHIRKVLKVFYDKNYSKHATARKIACYKSFFDFCINNDILQQNPMKSIKSPKIHPEEALPKYLTQNELVEVFQTIEAVAPSHQAWFNRLYPIIRLMYASMARISEICGLKIQDIDYERGLIKVRGKGNKERYIPIDQNTMIVLREYIENRKIEGATSSAPLFVNLRGKQIQPRTIQRDIHTLKGILENFTEKKLTPHVFRHTGATHLRQNGMDISELQDLLGHSSPNTTRIYAKNDMTQLKHSYKSFHPLAQEEHDISEAIALNRMKNEKT